MTCIISPDLTGRQWRVTAATYYTFSFSPFISLGCVTWREHRQQNYGCRCTSLFRISEWITLLNPCGCLSLDSTSLDIRRSRHYFPRLEETEQDLNQIGVLTYAGNFLSGYIFMLMRWTFVLPSVPFFFLLNFLSLYLSLDYRRFTFNSISSETPSVNCEVHLMYRDYFSFLVHTKSFQLSYCYKGNHSQDHYQFFSKLIWWLKIAVEKRCR